MQSFGNFAINFRYANALCVDLWCMPNACPVAMATFLPCPVSCLCSIFDTWEFSAPWAAVLNLLRQVLSQVLTGVILLLYAFYTAQNISLTIYQRWSILFSSVCLLRTTFPKLSTKVKICLKFFWVWNKYTKFYFIFIKFIQILTYFKHFFWAYWKQNLVFINFTFKTLTNCVIFFGVSAHIDITFYLSIDWQQMRGLTLCQSQTQAQICFQFNCRHQTNAQHHHYQYH